MKTQELILEHLQKSAQRALEHMKTQELRHLNVCKRALGRAADGRSPRRHWQHQCNLQTYEHYNILVNTILYLTEEYSNARCVRM